MKRFGVVLSLLVLAACQSGPSSPPTNPTNPTAPSLTLTPPSINVNAGDSPVTFVATVQNSTETVTWVYSGTGSITPTSGPATSYTPPASVGSLQSESLTAVLGTTGVSATAPIAVYPVAETPPSEPPPAPPPTQPNPPTDPTDPTTPDPTDPPESTSHTLTVTPPMNGKMFSEDMGDGIDCGGGANDCTANYDAGSTALLTVTPDAGWEVDSWGEDCSPNGGSNACVLTMDADKTASVTFKPAQPNVSGYWNVKVTANGTVYDFGFDLQQNGATVTGTWYTQGPAVPMTGTFDGTNLLLQGDDVEYRMVVSGDTMTGKVTNPGGTFDVTATRAETSPA